jgi:hypothetical protein
MLSVGELKQRLDRAQVSYVGIVEKEELKELVRQTYREHHDRWAVMSTGELKICLDRASVNYDGVLERDELMALARSRIR